MWEQNILTPSPGDRKRNCPAWYLAVVGFFCILFDEVIYLSGSTGDIDRASKLKPFDDLSSVVSSSPIPSDQDMCGDGKASIRVRNLPTGGGLLPTDQPPQPPAPSVTVPTPLTLQNGAFIRHLVGIKRQREQLQKLQDVYNSSLRKTQSWSGDTDETGEVPPARPDARLLTLRSDRIERFPPLTPVEPLSQDLVLPLTPTDAWKAVAVLRSQLVDLQQKLMHTRLMVIEGELRMEEAATSNKRRLRTIFNELREKEQNHKKCLLWIKNRRSQRCTNCSTSGKRTRLARALSEKLQEILTPMQLLVIRCGRKPRWARRISGAPSSSGRVWVGATTTSSAVACAFRCHRLRSCHSVPSGSHL